MADNISEQPRKSEMGLNPQELDSQFNLQVNKEQEDNTRKRFIEESRQLGYEPTQPEVEMYFNRNTFSDRYLQRCIDVEGIDISREQLKVVDENLHKWGENKDIIGDQTKELATNLYTSLWWRLTGLVEDTKTPEYSNLAGEMIDDAKNIRNALLSGNSDTPLKETIPYKASSLNGNKVQRFFSKITGFSQYQKIRNSLSEFGFGFGVIARKALENRYGDSLIVLIQGGDDERVRKTVVDSIIKLNEFYGLPRYTDKNQVNTSISLVMDAIEPIKNPLLVALNGTLGLIPRK